jgi:hypothetical protein
MEFSADIAKFMPALEELIINSTICTMDSIADLFAGKFRS